MREKDEQKYCKSISSENGYKVFYSINNVQPVRCSYIGEEPHFYLDIETSDGEEDSLFFAIEELESQINALKDNISQNTDIDLDSGKSVKTFEQFSENIKTVCCGEKKTISGNAIDLLRQVIEKSRFARELISFVDACGFEITPAFHTDTSYTDYRQKKVEINTGRAIDEQILLLAKELRRVWLYCNGGSRNPLALDSDKSVLVNRVQYADLCVAMIRIAWELSLEGYRGAWEWLETSSLGNMAFAFSREANLDFRTLNNGRAASVAFETWFLSEHCYYYDRALIQQMLVGANEFTAQTDVQAEISAIDQITATGKMPYGKNYLAEYAQLILSDPVFTEVRDRSNANFLWFIKFEKSFKESEHSLQSIENCHTDKFYPQHKILSDKSETYEKRGTVTFLFENEEFNFSREEPDRKNKTGKPAKVIRFPGEGRQESEMF